MLTPKENYLKMLHGEIPEYLPSMYDKRRATYTNAFLTPQSCPNGPIVTKLGVKYVPAPAAMMYGALPDPERPVLKDATAWESFVKLPDVSGEDFEKIFTERVKDVDRKQQYIAITGGDYFLTLVSIMGFENTFPALRRSSSAVIDMLEAISTYYLYIMNKEVQYVKPDSFSLMDDDSALNNPFFNLKTYQTIFKPFHKKHCDVANANGMVIERHDCGRSEVFAEDWVDMGVRAWNPAQTTNDLVGIKAKFGNKLAICGGWDSLSWTSESDNDELRAALKKYVDTFAPGGGFSFTAGIIGKADDPKTIEKRKLIEDFYNEYAKDWYKNH